jgi:Plasmid encoded RepA protein
LTESSIELLGNAGDLSPVAKRLLDGYFAILTNMDAVDRAFMAQQLVLCTLPHSDPGDVPRWIRRTNSAAIVMQPGWNAKADKSYGYPYGTAPRLLLFWIAAQVQATKNRTDMTDEQKRTLYLGKSMYGFMKAVGLDPKTGRGKRGDSKRLRKQVERLFNCKISFQAWFGSDRNQTRDFAADSELWWDTHHPEQEAMFQSWVLLGEAFYKSLLNSIPLDMRALKVLKNSPLKLDLYAWTCYKAYLILQKKQGPQFVAWKSLKEQFGTEYATVDDFRRKAKAALREIQGLYPGLILRKAKGGFKIHATRYAVLPDEKKVLYVDGDQGMFGSGDSHKSL